MRIGASLESMDQLKGSFDTNAGTVEELTSALDGQVSMITNGEWEGPAAQRFMEAWNSQFRPALQNLKSALADAAAEVQTRRNAIEQAGS